jgi:enoyl-[acyl-carrier protein] reductase I
MTVSRPMEGRTIVVTGVANKKSVAFHVGCALEEAGATPVYVVRSEQRRSELAKRFDGRDVFVCDVEREDEIEALHESLAERHPRLDGLVHSIAFANYRAGDDGALRPFHETRREDFLQAVDVSCFSLTRLAAVCRELFTNDASVVALSISDTHMAAANYGFMAPAKAALDSTVVFLAKSFSAFSEVRFNAVKAGPLKTSASAGIPGYLESYLFAEACTLRGRGVTTREVAETVLFLLSPLSAGINAQGLVVDAGMGVNYFDRAVVERATRLEDAARDAAGGSAK